MIWDSHPWRQELCRVADRLEEWGQSIDWDDELVDFEIERDVMVSAYAIRKLLEAQKLAESTKQERIHVEAYPVKDHAPDHMNWHRLDEHYDFERPTTEELTLDRLCNQLIHSFVFMPESTGTLDDLNKPGVLAGFLVASDWARSATLYRVGVSAFVHLLRLVGTEEIVASRMLRDATGEWQVSNLTRADIESGEPDGGT